MLSKFFIIPVVREKNRVKFALVLPTGAPTTPVNEMMDTLPLVAPKRLKSCLCN